MTSPDAPAPFRLGYVPGVTPAKWVTGWTERFPAAPLDLTQVAAADAAGLVRDGRVDAVLLRLPTDRDGLHAIPLYTEVTVVVVPKGHLFADADELSTSDLVDEVLLHPHDDTLGWERPPGQAALHRPDTTGDAIELVAAGVGLLVVPQSLARLHHRRDLTYRPLTDAPQSTVALSWLEDGTTDPIDDFIGIVRGRTPNSTRGRTPAKPQTTTPRTKPQPKPTSRGKTAAAKPGKRRRRG
ncbi:LysR family transcriptional regulator substrate-binding protein [Actinokineospora auranticolor]|uniref:LysR substrate binding domain-containing protein n=1 Tax=Actinokineospora auranticolor TaxID=155976 RepID=A0A2S6H162_9PSEU|nr:LysR family transcriptional regulator substrate-binding protein [Actinokineospora auranticolor]PPK71171.1 LysR substrate binding domain-containing protein [Actinokineospora auranticolor]